MPDAIEVNFDGLVGPTHNYSGLSYGNIASQSHVLSVSRPRAAALQGLEKMVLLHRLGLKQAILPPQERPHVPTLRALGFSGTDHEVLEAAWKHQPEMLMRCSSAAAMWTANAATVSPSADTEDHKIHITPANLSTNFHRFLETKATWKLMQQLFSHPDHFVVHEPLEANDTFADEGAANHLRFSRCHGEAGLEVFVFGRYAENLSLTQPKKFPARQTFEASKKVADRHLLDKKRVLFIQQHPDAIDCGVFHNDVISTGNETVFFYHEHAFVNTQEAVEKIQSSCETNCGFHLQTFRISQELLSLPEAVSSYIFNSQLVTLPNGKMALIAPQESYGILQTRTFIEECIQDRQNPIQEVYYLDLTESMKNGGGPACLRLRIVMNHQELSAMHQRVLFDEPRYQLLKECVEKYYPEEITPKDLADPQLYRMTCTALAEIASILELKHLYSFT
ncbi:MAG: N-succinylarginine dihydrolase [Chlamydiales bacterium]